MATRRNFIAGIVAAFAAATGAPALGSVSNDGNSRIKKPKRAARLDSRENPQKLLLDWYTVTKQIESSCATENLANLEFYKTKVVPGIVKW